MTFKSCDRLAAPLLGLLAAFGGLPCQPQQKRPVAPAKISSEVRAACDTMYAVAARTPGVSVRRRTGTFRDETIPKAVDGCGLAVSGSFARAPASGDAALQLRNDFEKRGWVEMPEYGAEGTDGTSFAFRKGKVACLARGRWNGGAEDVPPIPAQDWYRVTAFCTSPAFPEHRAAFGRTQIEALERSTYDLIAAKRAKDPAQSA